jgi:hypothetical protein
MTAQQRRERLPNRRKHRMITFDYDGRRFTACFGLHTDDRVGEVFLDCDRPDSLTAALARDAAILASLAIQHGAPIATIRKALTKGSDGLASGPLGRALDLLDGDSQMKGARHE